MVEKPSAEDAPSSLYMVGRYLLSPLVMDLLADQAPGKGGGPAHRRHAARARARGPLRRRGRPARGRGHRHPGRLDRCQRPHGRRRPALLRRLLGGRGCPRRAQAGGVAPPCRECFIGTARFVSRAAFFM